MSITLLFPYATYASGATVTLDRSTEAALVAQGRALYTVNYGSVFAPLTASEQQNLRDGGFAVAGNSPLTSSQAAAIALFTSPPFYGSGTSQILSGDTINIATYGDSRAACGVPNNAGTGYDMRTWVDASPVSNLASGRFTYVRGAAITTVYTAGQIVANCGVSGETLAQMITRESAGASASRKNLDDAWSVGARVLIFRAGINTITSAVTATSGYVQSTTDSIIADRSDLIRRAVNRGFLVIDAGEWGYDYVGDAANYPQSRIDAIRQTITAINVAAKAAADASNGYIVWIDGKSLLCDSAGQWLAGMCDDTANPGQRVHPSVRASFILAKAESAVLTKYFGACLPNYTRYAYGLSDTGNLIPNADMSASTGGLATGFGSSGGGTGFARATSILTRNGKRWQVFTATWTGASASNQITITLPIPIQSGGSISVTAGQNYGFEVDVFMDDGNGGAPPDWTIAGASNMLGRIRIYNAAGSLYYDSISMPASDTGAPSTAWEGKMVWNKITIADSTAAITASTAWTIVMPASSAVTGSVLRIGVSSPRMVRL